MSGRAGGSGRAGSPATRRTSATVEDALARSDALRLLAAGLRDPDGPDRPHLEVDPLVDVLRELGVGVAADEHAALGEIADREERATGHRRLFGHTIAHGCPPYETEYGQRHVFGQAQDLADIAGYYGAFGLQSSPSSERVDHVTCELEFLAILALKEAAALAGGNGEAADICRDAERSFVLNHLGRWLPALAGTAARQAPGAGHAVLLDLAARLVGARATALGVAPDRLGPDALRPIEEEAGGFAFECGDPDGGPGLEIPG